MNKFKSMALLLGMGLLMAQPVQAATLNCITKNNTSCIPIRTISEAFGVNVGFDQKAGTIFLTNKEQIVELKIGSTKANVDGVEKVLQAAPQTVSGTTYVPIRFIGEVLGGQVNYASGKLTVAMDNVIKEWEMKTIQSESTAASSGKTAAFTSGKKTVQGKTINYVTINMNDPKVKVKIATAQNKVTAAAPLKTLAGTAKASINGTYFAAYNGAVPVPDGTLVSGGKVLHITDIGSTLGITSDNKVLIDFVKTRVQGYVNGEEAWSSYRVNRATSDKSTTIIYTPEYAQKVQVPSGWSAVVCIDGKVNKIVKESRAVPANGFLLLTTKPEKFKAGDSVSYKVTYEPKNTSAAAWERVTHTLSAGPSLLINGQKTGDPAVESFTEAKILSQVAQRSFIGVNANSVVTIGTTSASVSQLKNIVKEMGFISAMCLDGGASSGLYYNGSYLTSPGRNVSNSINFLYQ